MTEVPDKQTEGTGTRGRGRGRGRGRTGEAEPVAAAARRRPSARSQRRREPPRSPWPPRRQRRRPRRRCRARSCPRGRCAGVRGAGRTDDVDERRRAATPSSGGPRRGRRRRRGRGRPAPAPPPRRSRSRPRPRSRRRGACRPARPTARVRREPSGRGVDEDEDRRGRRDRRDPAPRGPRPTPFGSVWDSQLGVPSRQRRPPRPAGSIGRRGLRRARDPRVPDRRAAARPSGAGRSRRPVGAAAGAAHAAAGAPTAAAMDRERYGRGGGGGINRYPDVSGRDRRAAAAASAGGAWRRTPGRRLSRPAARIDRTESTGAPRSGGDPWSEVPPELEEMLRAQLAQSGEGAGPHRPGAAVDAAAADELPCASAETPAERAGAEGARAPTTRPDDAAADAEAPRRTRRPRPTAAARRRRGRGPKRRTPASQRQRRAADAAPSPADDRTAAAGSGRTKRRTAADRRPTAASDAAPKRRGRRARSAGPTRKPAGPPTP